MADNVNVPVLVGAVPLFYVQKMTIKEGYKIERVGSSRFYQALSPATKTIEIQAVLLGPERVAIKKSLEIMALTSRLVVSAVGALSKYTGVPVVSGLTISLNMMVRDLSFTQSVDKRDALDVSMTLQEVPRLSAVTIIGEALDLSPAIASPFISSNTQPGSLSRTPGNAMQPPASGGQS